MKDKGNVELGVMLDCSRNAVFRPDKIKEFVDHISAMGYTKLYLYTEDTYEIESEPYFGYLRGKYSAMELRATDAYCASKGIELIPCIQTLAHLSGIMRWQKFYRMSDIDDILLVGDENVYELIDKMFATLEKTFVSRNINIGMDEAYNLGRGRYRDKYGDTDRSEIMAKHLSRVAEIAKKHGFRPFMWSDMFFRYANEGTYGCDKLDESKLKAIAEKLPDGVGVCYWDYYTTDAKHYDEMFGLHKKYFDRVCFAGGAQSWNGFAPSNRKSMIVADAAVDAVIRNGIDDVCVTLWGDGGGQCSFFAMLPTLMYYAERIRGNKDKKSIAEKFERIVGAKMQDFMLLDLPNEVGDPVEHRSNPSLYMLYNDYFSGVFDCTVKIGDGAPYAEYAKKLEKHADDEKFGYLFDAEAKLCKVLASKYELGLKTRNAYRSGDKKTLRSLAENEYTVLPSLLCDFADSFAVLWEKENKTTGAEIEDLRLGGLIRRTEHCKRLILRYLDEGEKIDELEEKLLEFYGDGETCRQKPITCTQYELCCSVNKLC